MSGSLEDTIFWLEHAVTYWPHNRNAAHWQLRDFHSKYLGVELLVPHTPHTLPPCPYPAPTAQTMSIRSHFCLKECSCVLCCLSRKHITSSPTTIFSMKWLNYRARLAESCLYNTTWSYTLACEGDIRKCILKYSKIIVLWFCFWTVFIYHGWLTSLVARLEILSFIVCFDKLWGFLSLKDTHIRLWSLK